MPTPTTSPQTIEPGHQIGWELLLGPLSGLSLVCIDAGNDNAIAALAERCKHLHVLSGITRRAADLTGHVQAQGWAHVSVASADAAITDDQVGAFDGLIVSDLSGQAQAHLTGGLRTLLQRTRPMLRSNAFVLLATPSRWGLSRERLMQGFRGSHAWSSQALSGLLRELGATSSRIHPVLLHDSERIAEVISPSGYRATKNAGLPKERLKQWLLGARTARCFAPALVAIGSWGTPRRALIDELSTRLTGPAGRWSQYLVLLSGKVIASFSTADHAAPSCVAVVTRDARAVSRRSAEAETLVRLTSVLPTALTTLLPRVQDRFSLDGNECFVLQHIPGVAADAVVPGMAQVTHACQQFALALHQATAVTLTLTEPLWAQGMGRIFASAIERNPIVADDLRQLEQQMRSRALGQPWVQVCSHGDFKIENVMYDPKSLQITGVIDWEHALIEGLPYIDLAYLLVYNRMLRGDTWLQAASALVQGRLSEDEQALEAEYWQATGLGPRLAGILRACTVVHHIGVRWHGDWSAAVRDEFKALIVACGKSVSSTPADSHAS